MKNMNVKKEKITEEALMEKLDNYLSKMESDNALPYYILSGSGPAMYYSIVDRNMICINRGVEVVHVPQYDDVYKGKQVAYIGDSYFILVNPDELIDIGFN